jgi:hypothetical protein
MRPFGVLLGAALVVVGVAPRARAAGNDVELYNLCPRSADGSCPWLRQDGATTRVVVDAEGNTRFRSMMSELGVVIAPRLQTPADTLGFSGFQISAELGTTQISHNRPFWDGVSTVDPTNRNRRRPDAWLTTAGAFVRKGMWLPVPAVEWGAGAVNVLNSGMWAIQGYVKLALHEGFHKWPLPSLAVRGAFSQLVGNDQVSLTVSSVDVLASKAFSLGGTMRVEPFLGWNLLFIYARSGVIDATPGCDAYRLQGTSAANAASLQDCAPAQAGTWGDLGANFTYPEQDVITRSRYYAGMKLKLTVLFLSAQFALIPGSGSRDESAATFFARDDGRRQLSISVSAGFDF